MTKSPFPGMDPYLEGHLWHDVHNSLTYAIKTLLAPQISPKYVARIEVHTTIDLTPESEIGITYPDVAVLNHQNWVREPMVAYENATVATEPTIIIPDYPVITLRIPVVEIRDVAQNRLITAIEILSPVNKKKPGSEKYQEKRLALHRSGVNLLEIDLLRRGTRPLVHPLLLKSDYAMLLWRANAHQTEAWMINLADVLPILPIPLADSDPDALLDLKKALDMIYANSLYELSIDYQKDQPPPPELSAENQQWRQTLLKNAAI